MLLVWHVLFVSEHSVSQRRTTSNLFILMRVFVGMSVPWSDRISVHFRDMVALPPMHMEHRSGLRPWMLTTPGHAVPFWYRGTTDERSGMHHQ